MSSNNNCSYTMKLTNSSEADLSTEHMKGRPELNQKIFCHLVF